MNPVSPASPKAPSQAQRPAPPPKKRYLYNNTTDVSEQIRRIVSVANKDIQSSSANTTNELKKTFKRSILSRLKKLDQIPADLMPSIEKTYNAFAVKQAGFPRLYKSCLVFSEDKDFAPYHHLIPNMSHLDINELFFQSRRETSQSPTLKEEPLRDSPFNHSQENVSSSSLNSKIEKSDLDQNPKRNKELISEIEWLIEKTSESLFIDPIEDINTKKGTFKKSVSKRLDQIHPRFITSELISSIKAVHDAFTEAQRSVAKISVFAAKKPEPFELDPLFFKYLSYIEDPNPLELFSTVSDIAAMEEEATPAPRLTQSRNKREISPIDDIDEDMSEAPPRRSERNRNLSSRFQMDEMDSQTDALIDEDFAGPEPSGIEELPPLEEFDKELREAPLRRSERKRNLPARFQTNEMDFQSLIKLEEPTDEETAAEAIRNIKAYPKGISLQEVIERIQIHGENKEYSKYIQYPTEFKKLWAANWNKFKIHQNHEIKKRFERYLREIDDPAEEYVTIVDSKHELLGYMAFATQEIPENFLLGEYAGIVTLESELSEENVHRFRLDPDDNHFLSKWDIDAQKTCNWTSFAAHNSEEDANLHAVIYYDQEGPHVLYFTNQIVKVGEPLTVCYGTKFFNQDIEPIRIKARLNPKLFKKQR